MLLVEMVYKFYPQTLIYRDKMEAGLVYQLCLELEIWLNIDNGHTNFLDLNIYFYILKMFPKIRKGEL